MPRKIGCEHASPRCGECNKLAKRAWYEKNKEREQAKALTYYETHKEELCAKKRGKWVSTPEIREYNRIYQKAYREKHPEKVCANVHGAIFPEGIFKRDLFAKQQGKCTICERGPLPNNPLVVDHDPRKPDVANVRDLIHSTCNAAIGALRTPKVMRAAADYVERHQGWSDEEGLVINFL